MFDRGEHCEIKVVHCACLYGEDLCCCLMESNSMNEDVYLELSLLSDGSDVVVDGAQKDA